MLSGAFSSISKISRIKCADMCLQTSCLSINYHSQNEECQLNTDSPYTNPVIVQEVQDWAIYFLQKDNDWEMVFRAMSNNGLRTADAWMGTPPPPTPVEEGCRLLTTSSTCTSIYRSEHLNTWNSENISEVKLELYKAGVRVVNIRFDGKGSNYIDWFGTNRLIDSGWKTMSKSRLFEHFSIYGFCWRKFYINQSFGGCSNDQGWMVVIDVNLESCSCRYDIQSDRPAFLFAPGEDITRWNNHNYDRADVLAIFIKR
ncbi:uncharacterized protein LOC132558784 [Ylistrum balloti]|uniref:uncharacterized protein LOC132558784 n=1 Tax=Ylistrum balloti TaxID=509963 RepID=UPI002905EC73|nr:uncharacterized protein LOC132558784 [Ylistrum balloti]